MVHDHKNYFFHYIMICTLIITFVVYRKATDIWLQFNGFFYIEKIWLQFNDFFIYKQSASLYFDTKRSLQSRREWTFQMDLLAQREGGYKMFI